MLALVILLLWAHGRLRWPRHYYPEADKRLRDTELLASERLEPKVPLQESEGVDFLDSLWNLEQRVAALEETLDTDGRIDRMSQAIHNLAHRMEKLEGVLPIDSTLGPTASGITPIELKGASQTTEPTVAPTT